MTNGVDNTGMQFVHYQVVILDRSTGEVIADVAAPIAAENRDSDTRHPGDSAILERAQILSPFREECHAEQVRAGSIVIYIFHVDTGDAQAAAREDLEPVRTKQVGSFDIQDVHFDVDAAITKDWSILAIVPITNASVDFACLVEAYGKTRRRLVFLGEFSIGTFQNMRSQEIEFNACVITT